MKPKAGVMDGSLRRDAPQVWPSGIGSAIAVPVVPDTGGTDREIHPECHREAMTVTRINRRRPVLLVSRDVDTQDMYVIALRAERIPALSVSGCRDAVAVARQMDIAVVLFDVERPADWESVSELRRELPADVPIVILTGWVRTDGENRVLARKLGCSGFLAKPVPPPVMIDVLHRATAGCPWTEYVSEI
jgi:two-component system cell cycle response regulator DivK